MKASHLASCLDFQTQCLFSWNVFTENFARWLISWKQILRDDTILPFSLIIRPCTGEACMIVVDVKIHFFFRAKPRDGLNARTMNVKGYQK